MHTRRYRSSSRCHSTWNGSTLIGTPVASSLTTCSSPSTECWRARATCCSCKSVRSSALIEELGATVTGLLLLIGGLQRLQALCYLQHLARLCLRLLGRRVH